MEPSPEGRADLLATELRFHFGQAFIGGVSSHPLRWRDQEKHKFSLRIPSEGKTIPPGLEKWLAEQGWMIQAAQNAFRISPLVTTDLPDFCYHATPSTNLSSIRARGLLTGSAAGVSTTGWPDSQESICVSFTLKDAEDWTSENLLGKKNHEKEWTILSIAREGTSGAAIRDGASQTGYLLIDKRVLWEFLRVVNNVSK